MNEALQIYLAPFQGITGEVYRKQFARHFTGVDKLFTAFFTAIHKEKSLSAKAAEFDSTYNNGKQVIPQILSKDGEEMLRFVNFCHNKGFTEINWNMGCPYPRVANKKRGSGLIPHAKLVDDILAKIMPGIPLKLSIKTRLGLDNTNEILNLIPVLNKYPISELIVHARFGKQLYKGNVDILACKNAFEISKIPVAYNGDIFNLEDYSFFEKQFPDVKRWMIGRGLLVDPFLAADIKGSSLAVLSERKQLIRKFVDDLYYAYRKKMNDRPQAVNVLKELWSYLCYSFNEPHRVFSRLKKTRSFDEYEDAVNDIFNNHEWLGSESGQFKSAVTKHLQ